MRDHFLSTAENLQSGLKQERKILSEWITRHAQINMNGYIQIEKVPPSEGLLYLIRAVSGQGGMVDRNSLIELRQRMKHLGFKAGTLGGAHIIKVGDQFLITRDPVIAKGRKGQKAPLGCHKLKRGGQIWDGRFLIENQHDRPLHVRPAWGFIDRLGRVVKEIPSEARPTLPVVLN